MVLDETISDFRKKINEHQVDLFKFFEKALIVKQRIPPARNENKMVYGKMIEICFIEFLNKIFVGCSELDKEKKTGSSYMNDCNVQLNNEHSINLSIKVSAQGGDIIVINKHGNDINYETTMKDLVTIIIRLDKYDLLIIPHKMVLEWGETRKKEIFRNNNANLQYRSSLFTLFYGKKDSSRLSQNMINKYKITLSNKDLIEDYRKREINNLKPIDWCRDLLNKITT